MAQVRRKSGETALIKMIIEDLHVVRTRDPARRTVLEALLHAPWHGLALHRVAHRLHARGHRTGPAFLRALTRTISGVDIHPGASVGRRAFLDHGFGIAIGQFCVIGDDVTIYHRVTLSSGDTRACDVDTSPQPLIGNQVIIGTGASVLGPVVVGDGVRIRAHSLVAADRRCDKQCMARAKNSTTPAERTDTEP